MNLSDIRQGLFDQVDWQPETATVTVDKINRFINRAYQQIANEVPYLFFEGKYSFATQADVEFVSSVASDRLTMDAADPYVLQRTPTAGDVAWVFDGTWESRQLEIKDPNGVWHRRVIRELSSGAPQRVYIDRPWANNSDANMEYRITTMHYPLPADITELKSIRLWDQQFDNTFDIILRDEAEARGLDGVRGEPTSGSTPTQAYRQNIQLLPPPTTAPGVALGSSTWVGGVPAGKFDYKITYVWGKKDAEYETSLGIQEPLWESSPSPVSAKITTAFAPVANQNVVLTLPNIDWMLNYGPLPSAVVPTRSGKSGVRIRIYRRRYSAVGGNPVSVDGNVTASAGYYLLAEVEGDSVTYSDNGTVMVDRRRRLKEVNATETLQLFPRPDKRYDVDVRYAKRPDPLEDDTDVPTLPPDALNLLVHRSLELLYEALGNAAYADRARRLFENNLTTLNKRHGMLPKGVFRKKLSRVRGHRGGQRFFTVD